MPKFTLILSTALSLFLGNALAQEKNAKLTPVAYLRLAGCEQAPDSSILAKVKPQAGDILVHEVCRQAVLMAIRDSGKVITHDEGIGDQEPAKNQSGNFLFDMRSKYVPGKLCSIHLDLDVAAKPKELWNHELVLDQQKQTIEQLIETLEEKSRTDIAAILSKELSPGSVAPAAKPDFKAINTLLDDFHLLAQFEALRRLHSANTGNDPATLIALARGYAQIALLTRYHWTHQHRVFQARSLLYAQRLLALHPKESGQSTLASCLSLAGYHKQALARFDLEEKAGEKLSPWASLAKLASMFDYEALEARAANEDEHLADLANYLAFRILAREPSTRLSGLTAPATRLGMAIVERRPESYPVIHRLSMGNALGIKQQMTLLGQEVLARTLPSRLTKMAGLPQSVKDTLSTAVMLRDCPVSLIKEGEQDANEPSWSSVGQAIMQTYFQQVQQRIEFMHSFWVVPTKDYLEEVMPLLAGHPQAGVINVAAGDTSGANRPFTHPKRGDNRYLDLAQYCRSLLGDKVGIAMFFQFLYQRPYNGDDLAMMEPLWPDTLYLRVLGAALLAESPYHPFAPAMLFRSNTPNVLESLPVDHEKRFGSHTIYLFEYGQWLMRNQKLAEAEQILTKLVKLNPNSGGYEALAGYYLKVNNRVKWEETLQAYLKIPDAGLQPASTRLDLAEYHASQKNWDKAKTYAAEAAETYAAWALFRASRVFAMAGDYETSENYIKAMSGRYSDSVDQWFRWCIRYNRGDRAAAYALIKGMMDRKGSLTRVDNMLLGFCHEAMNQPKEAISYFSKVYAGGKNLDVAVRSALLEADQGNKDERDSWIVKALIPDKTRATSKDYQAQLKITEMIFAANKSGTVPDLEAVEQIVDGISEPIRQSQYYLLGRLCEQLKDVEKAQTMYRKGLMPKQRDSWTYLLCEVRLKALSGNK